MTALEMLLARDLVADLRGILSRNGMALTQLNDVRDRVYRHERDAAAAAEGADALLVHHFRTCHDCVTGPGCPMAREIAEHAVQTRAA